MSAFKKIFKSFLISVLPSVVIVYRGKAGSKKIALTFDDGPHHEFTPKCLDILQKFNIKATFFLLGQAIDNNTELAKRIIREGHGTGTHAYTHKGYGRLPLVEQKKEIIKGRDTLKRTGRDSRLFRPPQGHLSIGQVFFCIREKLQTAMWTIDSLDYQKKGKDHIMEQIKGKITGGDIILMHDDNPVTLDALPEIIRHARDKGLEFVTVEDLLK